MEKKSYGIGVVILVMVALLELVPPYIVRLVVDGIQQHSISRQSLITWLCLLLASGLVTFLLRYIWRNLIFGSAAKLGLLLRDRLYENFTKQSPQFYHQHRTGDLMAHSTNDIQAVEMTAGEGILTLVDSTTMGGLVIFSMAVFISWKLTLLTLLIMPIMGWATSRLGTLLHERFLEAQAAFSELNEKVQENISGVRVIKSFGQEMAETASFENLSAQVVEKNMAVAKIDSLYDPVIKLIVGSCFFVSLAVGGWFVERGQLTIGQLTQFVMYLGYLIWPMLAFGWLINIMQRGRASYDRVQKLLAIQPDVYDRQGAAEQIPAGDIHFQIRSFAYPGKTEAALRNIDVEVKRGQTLGIVGKTGSGKSTLLRLLVREFDVIDGDIEINGRSIYDYTLHALRSAIGYVPQDLYLFSSTVRENIAFGKPDASFQEIEAASRLAAIHSDILHFEHGYDTVVGERGVTLSGGQKQRISIARAVLLHPEILVLDDCLSAVDARTEKAILEGLRENRKNKTTLIATHRLSAVEHADQILVLEEGGISQRGTHEDLIQQGGWYAEMYGRQLLESLVEQGVGTDGDVQADPLHETTP